ncbi:hypothetical protein Amn_17700 [Aminobacter sp. Y103A]|uniref:hypothetical protein n=1 Tax=Aminobacter sp. Y103A TaxID=1870862 RepID=UPI00257307A3|nr:hypothetical protein [Aminobacter sp. SS-2016]BBD36890.1 hypothetical protein Amn_17700 [Aminobacter sp. SS-2016]
MGERPKTQREKFEEAARELKTNQSDEAFEAVVNKIAHAPKVTAEQVRELVRRKASQKGQETLDTQNPAEAGFWGKISALT